MDRQDENVTFSPLAEADLPLMHKWLNTPHVKEWYRDWGAAGPTLEQVVNKFLPRARHAARVDSHIILFGAQPIGHIQTYRLPDFPATAGLVTDREHVAGVDILIGEEACVHKGLGCVVLQRYLREIVFVAPDVNSCIIDPEPENRIAIRAYEKAGFRFTHYAWNEQDNVRAYVMVIRREEVTGDSGAAGDLPPRPML